MTATLGAKLALARTVGTISRWRGGGATSAPGRVLMRLNPTRSGRSAAAWSAAAP